MSTKAGDVYRAVTPYIRLGSLVARSSDFESVARQHRTATQSICRSHNPSKQCESVKVILCFPEVHAPLKIAS